MQISDLFTHHTVCASISLNSLHGFVAHMLFLFTFIYDIHYSVSLRIQSECGKIQTRLPSNEDTFYAVPT